MDSTLQLGTIPHATASLVVTIRSSCFHSGRHIVVAFKSKAKCFTVTVKIQHCRNISILLWQHVSVLLDHPQASIKRYEVQSVHIMYCGYHTTYRVYIINSLKL